MSGTTPIDPTPPLWWQPTIYYNSPISMNAAGDGTLLVGWADGHVYSFNPTKQAMSLLEDVEVDLSAGHLLWFVGGHLNNRIAAYDNADDNTTLTSWVSDTESATEATSAVNEGSIWDFDLPEQTKLIDGIVVVCDVPPTGCSVTISYQTDQDGTWTSLDPIDDTATGLRHFLPVSVIGTTVKCSTLQVRTRIDVVDLNVAVALRVYSVTAQARVPDFSETWEILVKLQDEGPNQRTSKRQSRADVLRQYLWDTMRAKDVVRFRDGAISGIAGEKATPTPGYAEVAVTIESIEDFIDRKGEGKAKVTLRRVLTDGDSGTEI